MTKLVSIKHASKTDALRIGAPKVPNWQLALDQANGKFPPRVAPFTYCEKMKFESLGQPMLNYQSISWHSEEKHAMHQERGFLKINPGTNKVVLLAALSFGMNSMEEGVVDNGAIHLKSTEISKAAFNREPAVIEIERFLRLQRDGRLEVVTHMATVLNPTLTEHLVAVYEKIH